MEKNSLAHLFEFAFLASDQRSTIISFELLSNDTTHFAVYNTVLMGARFPRRSYYIAGACCTTKNNACIAWHDVVSD